jgi:ubiquitin thioesterase protein OTUB1
MEVIDHVGKGPTFFSQKELHKMFNDQGYSDYIVVYLRLITSGQLQRDSEFYQHFIEGDRSVADFCHQVSLKGH